MAYSFKHTVFFQFYVISLLLYMYTSIDWFLCCTVWLKRQWSWCFARVHVRTLLLSLPCCTSTSTPHLLQCVVISLQETTRPAPVQVMPPLCLHSATLLRPCCSHSPLYSSLKRAHCILALRVDQCNVLRVESIIMWGQSAITWLST